MKAGWRGTSLGDVCEIYQPKTISAKDMVPDGPYPVFGANGVIGRYSEFNHEEPQLLVTCRGATCGSVNISDPFSWITGNAMVIRPKVTDLSLRYVEYFFRGAVDLDGVITGAAQPQITRKSLAPVRIAFPPLEEQQRIVAVLDEAFEGLARARENAEVNLKNARELFAAELNQLFEHALSTTPEKTFDEITFNSSIGLVRSKKEQGPDRQYDYVKMQNIGNDDRYLGGVVDRIDCSPEEGARFQLERGDLLFNTRNSRELVGKSCIIEEDFERPTVFNNNIMRVRFSSVIYPRYVALAFKSASVKAQLEAMKSGTTSVVAIYHKSLKKLRLPVPDQQEQRIIVDRFDELDGAVQCLLRNYKRQIGDIDDLRQSLLQKAFAGELT